MSQSGQIIRLDSRRFVKLVDQAGSDENVLLIARGSGLTLPDRSDDFVLADLSLHRKIGAFHQQALLFSLRISPDLARRLEPDVKFARDAKTVLISYPTSLGRLLVQQDLVWRTGRPDEMSLVLRAMLKLAEPFWPRSIGMWQQDLELQMQLYAKEINWNLKHA